MARSGRAGPGGGRGRPGVNTVTRHGEAITLGFPLALYFLIAGPNRGELDFAVSGSAAPLYYMVALAGFGTMMGMVSTGTRIAGERQVGWTRQLRVTPLSSSAYLRAKVPTAYALAGVSVASLYLAGASVQESPLRQQNNARGFAQAHRPERKAGPWTS